MTSSLHRRFCLRRSRTSAAKSYAKIPQLSAKNLFLNNIIKVPTFQLSKMIFPSNQVTFEHALPSNPAFPAAHRFGALPQDISFIPRRSFHFQPFLLVPCRTQCFSEPFPHGVSFVSHRSRIQSLLAGHKLHPTTLISLSTISSRCQPTTMLFSNHILTAYSSRLRGFGACFRTIKTTPHK